MPFFSQKKVSSGLTELWEEVFGDVEHGLSLSLESFLLLVRDGTGQHCGRVAERVVRLNLVHSIKWGLLLICTGCHTTRTAPDTGCRTTAWGHPTRMTWVGTRRRGIWGGWGTMYSVEVATTVAAVLLLWLLLLVSLVKGTEECDHVTLVAPALHWDTKHVVQLTPKTLFQLITLLLKPNQ